MLPNTPLNGYENGRDEGGPKSTTSNLSTAITKMNLGGPPSHAPALPTFRPTLTSPLFNGNAAQASPRGTLPGMASMPSMPRLPQFAPASTPTNGHFHSSASQPLIHGSAPSPAPSVYPQQVVASMGNGQTLANSHSQPNLANQQRLGQSSNQGAAGYSPFPPSNQQQQHATHNPSVPSYAHQQQLFNPTPASYSGGQTAYQQESSSSEEQRQSTSSVGQWSGSYPGQPYSNEQQQSASYAGQTYGATPSSFSQQHSTPQAMPLPAAVPHFQQALPPGQVQSFSPQYAPPPPPANLFPAGSSGPVRPYYPPAPHSSGQATGNAGYQPQQQQQEAQQQAQHLPQPGQYPQPFQGNMPNGAVQNFSTPNGARYGHEGGGAGQLDGNSHHAEGSRLVNLLSSRRILPPAGIVAPTPEVRQTYNNITPCSPDVFRCTLNVIPSTPALLQKARLPLAILIHPYRDLSSLQVLSCNTIVRCRSCRSYINPFVTFIDQYKWRCNLCDRTNDLPQEFFHDPVTNTVGDPARRPEIRTATIEYIAPAEYALRPPQPAMYVFLLDVSFNAIEVRYLDSFRERLLTVLERLPGDARTQVAFIAYDSALHFFQLDNNDWKMLSVADIDDVFIPSTEGLLVRLHENMEAVRDLVGRLPEIFKGQRDTHSCMGAALQIGHKLLATSGGRITVLQTYLPTLGPGALKAREDPNLRAAKEVKFLEPATDFYKTLALECSANQVAVDLFLFAGQYADLTTISGIARYSGGCIHYYPAFNSVSNPVQLSRFESDFTRYLTRKIGFEAVMRVRCTNGMSLTAFHGNFFVRSVDLLSLPNINPDSGFAVQLKMDDPLVQPGNVCFQAALLYTSSKGERRIRVHTLSIPVSQNLTEIFAAADQEAIACIVGKIAAERALTQPLADVRDGIVFACEDALRAYTQVNRPAASQVHVPYSLRLLPLFTHSLLNCVGLRTGVSTTLDQRTFSLLQLKAAPLSEEMMTIYPSLYAVHKITDAPETDGGVPQLERLHLSFENIERGGVYLLEGPMHMILYVTESVNRQFCQDILGVSGYDRIQERCAAELSDKENEASRKLRAFITDRYAARPLHPILEVIKETGKDKVMFSQYLYDDRTDSVAQSYYEFLTELMRKIKNG